LILKTRFTTLVEKSATVTKKPDDTEPKISPYRYRSDEEDDGQGFYEPMEPPELVRDPDPASLRAHTRQLMELLRARYPDAYQGVEIGTLPIDTEDDLFSDWIDMSGGLGVRIDYNPESTDEILFISAGNRDCYDPDEILDFERKDGEHEQLPIQPDEIEEIVELMDKYLA